MRNCNLAYSLLFLMFLMFLITCTGRRETTSRSHCLLTTHIVSR